MFEQSGTRCTKCKRDLVIEDEDGKQMNISQLAHIQSLRSGGPSELSNFILLCPICHFEVDTDNIKWTTDRLLKLKKNHFEWISILTDAKSPTVKPKPVIGPIVMKRLDEMYELLTKVSDTQDRQFSIIMWAVHAQSQVNRRKILQSLSELEHNNEMRYLHLTSFLYHIKSINRSQDFKLDEIVKRIRDFKLDKTKESTFVVKLKTKIKTTTTFDLIKWLTKAALFYCVPGLGIIFQDI